jgi:purine nucleoside phosphorylase
MTVKELREKLISVADDVDVVIDPDDGVYTKTEGVRFDKQNNVLVIEDSLHIHPVSLSA